MSFDPLSQVPLGDYQPVAAAPATVASRRAPRGGDLLPSQNLGGLVSQPVTIDLPADRFGQPPLTLSENWVKEGVAVAILSEVDKTSVVLFTLILAVAVLAGLPPAWLAARADPVSSVRPPVLAVRRAHQPRGITSLAALNVARTPGRTLIGVVSLAVGIAALTMLTAVTSPPATSTPPTPPRSWTCSPACAPNTA